MSGMLSYSFSESFVKYGTVGMASEDPVDTKDPVSNLCCVKLTSISPLPPPYIAGPLSEGV